MDNDLISRSALKEAIDDYSEKGTLHWLSDIEEIIDNVPAVEAKTTHDVNSAYDRGFITAMKAYSKPQGEWIPVSEKLPEENGRYLVTRGLNACGAMWSRAYIINYSDLMGLKSERIWWDGNVGKSDFKRFDDVIAWMPLPEPYKQDGADK